MIKKIISGGQTGADRAALDFAIKFDIPHGGWIARGRKAEDGRLPEHYRLQEIPEPSYTRRTEKNVLDSDGTLIISRGYLTGGSHYTRKMAIFHRRPWLHIDLTRTSAFNAGKKIRGWIDRNKIEVLNVAGPRNSKEPTIYKSVFDILETAFFLDLIETGMPGPAFSETGSNDGSPGHRLPETVEQAADEIITSLSFPERTRMANLNKEKLEDTVQLMAGRVIRKFLLDSQNRELMNSCGTLVQDESIDATDAARVIIRRAWEKLRWKKNVLRIVK